MLRSMAHRLGDSTWKWNSERYMSKVSQDRIHTLYMTVCLVIFLPKLPEIHRIYGVLANPTHYLSKGQKISVSNVALQLDIHRQGGK
jgi:hypothetical protein